jgi:hypothetical protein
LALSYGAAGAGNWAVQTVDSEGPVGWNTSIALDQNDRPHISYEGSSAVRYARWDGAACAIETVAQPGNVDGNGVVDGLDLTAVLTAWETEPGHPLWNAQADLDGNGVINGLDLTEVISNWTTAAAVPPAASEPTETEAVEPGRRGPRRGQRREGKGQRTGEVAAQEEP